MTDKPNVNLDFSVHWCDRHLEPFREDWPSGAGVAMLRLFDAVVQDERIAAAAPKNAKGEPKTESLNAVLLEHSPLCCFIGDERMKAIYEETGKEPPGGGE